MPESGAKPHVTLRAFSMNETGFSAGKVLNMGGLGSGSLPDHSGGRKKKQAVAVEGVGVPEKPDGLPSDVSTAWDSLVSLTSGVCFSQDAELLLECSTLKVRQDAFRRALSVNPTDIDLNRMSLAVGRALLLALGKLGLTPRDRQVLLVPRPDPRDDSDPIQPSGRKPPRNGGVPNRRRDLGK